MDYTRSIGPGRDGACGSYLCCNAATDRRTFAGDGQDRSPSTDRTGRCGQDHGLVVAASGSGSCDGESGFGNSCIYVPADGGESGADRKGFPG